MSPVLDKRQRQRHHLRGYSLPHHRRCAERGRGGRDSRGGVLRPVEGAQLGGHRRIFGSYVSRANLIVNEEDGVCGALSVEKDFFS